MFDLPVCREVKARRALEDLTRGHAGRRTGPCPDTTATVEEVVVAITVVVSAMPPYSWAVRLRLTNAVRSLDAPVALTSLWAWRPLVSLSMARQLVRGHLDDLDERSRVAWLRDPIVVSVLGRVVTAKLLRGFNVVVLVGTLGDDVSVVPPDPGPENWKE